jgi:hypothetical protein
VVSIAPRQTRYQSGAKDVQPSKDAQSNRAEQKDLTFRQFWGRALTVSLRNLAFAMSPQGIRKSYRDSPISTAVILLMYVHFLGILPLYMQMGYNTNRNVTGWP